MPLAPWKKLTHSVVSRNGYWTYCKDEYELPSGRRGEYFYVHTNGASLIIPVTQDGRILLVRQYRYLCSRESIEFPCGGVKDGTSHNETAWHELREETGYTSDRVLLAGSFNPYNGVTDEICNVYIARDLKYVGVEPDETEEFEQLSLAPEEIDAKIADGTIWDGMTIAAWGIVRGKL
jgi:ADP-ribose pyrophosphatase